MSIPPPHSPEICFYGLWCPWEGGALVTTGQGEADMLAARRREWWIILYNLTTNVKLLGDVAL